MSTDTVTVIGIGNIGAAVAQALLNAGTPTAIWNRTKDRPPMQPLVDAGADFRDDVGDAISVSNCIILTLLNHDSMYAAFQLLAGPLVGKTIVNLITGTPQQAIAAERWFKERGAALYFDGASMAPPYTIGTKDATIFYSGESNQKFDTTVLDILSPLSGGIVNYEGPAVGAASAMDLAAQSAMYGMLSGAFIGMALLKNHPATNAIENLGATQPNCTPGVEKAMIPFLSSMVPYLNQMSKVADEGRWMDSQGNPVSLLLTCLNTVMDACKEANVDASMLTAMAEVMDKVLKNEGGDAAISTVVKYLKC